MTQIPADKKFLPNFAWFDYIRPLDKNDIFNWRGKRQEQELKPEKRREAPVQTLKKSPPPVAPAVPTEPAEPAASTESVEPSAPTSLPNE